MPSGRRIQLTRLAQDTAIVLAVSLGLMVALEGALRLFWPQELVDTRVRGAHFANTDSVLGVRYTPNAIWRFRHPEYSVVYAINGQGFRDKAERPYAKPVGTIRVLLLGDSFTFGQGVNSEDTWAALAERELRRQGRTFDLVNAGMQGMDTGSELTLLRRLARRSDADAVVLGFLINDLYTNRADQPPKASDGAADHGPLQESSPSVYRRIGEFQGFHLVTLARRLLSSFDAGYIALYLALPERGDYLRVPLSETAHQQLQITEKLLRQMAAYCDSLGKPLIVLSIPQLFQVLYAKTGRTGEKVDVGYYDRHFAGVAAKSGFGWVASLPDLVEAARGSKELFYRLDGHLTTDGNAAVAGVFVRRVVPAILTALRTRGTAPEQPRSP
jgi:lysophospholipase L1-like esterase